MTGEGGSSSLPLIISIVSAVISFASAYFAYSQYRKMARQIATDVFFRVNDINRDLIKLGFEDSRFFDILDGQDVPDPRLEQRYLQLWLNQASSAFSAYEAGLLSRPHWMLMRSDLLDFFRDVAALRRHWTEVRAYHTPSFRTEMDDLLKQAETVINPIIQEFPSHRWTGREDLTSSHQSGQNDNSSGDMASQPNS
ncbi:hypothetical protein I6F07_13735 [Ensifer sp. IC4062]|nr:hypothetical protein [Ensifer sp. IC4062]MCA1441254.1 hypothetical protein [Ensifer sp. IC4062]